MLELELMELIYQGVDPRTGELLNAVRDPVIDKRRAAYLQTLRRAARAVKPVKRSGSAMSEAKTPLDANKPANHGARWSEQEEAHLLERYRPWRNWRRSLAAVKRVSLPAWLSWAFTLIVRLQGSKVIAVTAHMGSPLQEVVNDQHPIHYPPDTWAVR